MTLIVRALLISHRPFVNIIPNTAHIRPHFNKMPAKHKGRSEGLNVGAAPTLTHDRPSPRRNLLSTHGSDLNIPKTRLDGESRAIRYSLYVQCKSGATWGSFEVEECSLI